MNKQKEERINLLALAKKIHNYAIAHNISSITSWLGFYEIYKEWGFKEDKYQIYRAIRKGQKVGFFSEGYWVGIGMTPWSGSARRARFYDIWNWQTKEKGGRR